ncbi:MAG: hypothetical protein ER33_09835 [Cyanobium sp. CACIAM 14]|nr:MAG: hypothetical protein ER33_09835 [Cyanobium sp. CACIAM 14]
MLHRLLLRARYLTLVPILGLLVSCLALFIRGSRLILEQLQMALAGSTGVEHLNRFEVELLEGIDLLLVGTGCLALAIGMFSLFISELKLPKTLSFRNFHEVKGLFANFIILAMAIAFLEQLNSFQQPESVLRSSGAEIFFSGAGMAVVTLALLAFKNWGGEPAGPLPGPRELD